VIRRRGGFGERGRERERGGSKGKERKEKKEKTRNRNRKKKLTLCLPMKTNPLNSPGLLKPFDVLLLDEITVDLDVLGRADLMKFLTDECNERNATVIYATHIFDGLDSWPTHVAFLARGKLRRMHTSEELKSELEQGRLLELVESWLRHEEAEAEAERNKGTGGLGGGNAATRGGTGAGNDGVASWSNGWAAGRMTSTLKNSSNAVMRM
jgi:CCR4-NOT complex subunit CAF16